MPKKWKETGKAINWERHDEVSNKLKNESDHGVALITAAYLDIALESTLRLWLRDNDATPVLFEPHGALGPFSNKIHMARALGVIGEREYTTFKALNKIRRLFAHNIDVSFDTPPVSDVLAEFGFLEEAIWEASPNGGEIAHPREWSRRGWYIVIYTICASTLTDRAVKFEEGKKLTGG